MATVLGVVVLLVLVFMAVGRISTNIARRKRWAEDRKIRNYYRAKALERIEKEERERDERRR